MGSKNASSKAASNMSPTTLERCVPILKYLRYTFTVPLKFVYAIDRSPWATDPSTTASVFKGVELETGINHYITHILLLIYHTLKLSFCSIQFFRLWIWKEKSEVLLVTGTYFPFFSFLLAGSLLRLAFQVKKIEIICFLNKWHLVEKEIHTTFRDKNRLGLSTAASQTYRSLRNVRVIVVLLTTLIFLFGMTNRKTRRSIMFLYSIVDVDVEIPWLLAISLIDGLLTVHSTWPAYTALDLFVEGFPRCTLNCLELICSSNGNRKCEISKVCSFKASDSESNIFESAIRMYNQLENLVEEFNSIFSQYLFYGKVVCVSVLCGTVYACLKPHDGTDVYNVIIFIMYATTALSRQIRSLGEMGKVYNQSANFKQTWLSTVSNETHIVRLQNLPRIQFQIGEYYGVTPTTILSLLSVTTTYIIVLLQL